MFTITYTMEELQVLTRLLDMAVKAGGLGIAADAVILHQKHIAATQVKTTLHNEPESETKEA